MSDRTAGLSAEEEQALRSNAETQDAAYRDGAYDYLLAVDMAPRMATIAAYLRHFGAKSVLDVGCGWGELLSYLDPQITFLGLDISETALAEARVRFAGRPEASFHAGNFRDWESPIGAFDALVWAGIGRSWNRAGRKSALEDWLEILDLAERPLKPDGFVIVEMVTPHWETLEGRIEGRYDYRAGCDIDHLRFDHRAKRSIRVFQRLP